jgi:hypothetical protein
LYRTGFSFNKAYRGALIISNVATDISDNSAVEVAEVSLLAPPSRIRFRTEIHAPSVGPDPPRLLPFASSLLQMFPLTMFGNRKTINNHMNQEWTDEKTNQIKPDSKFKK